MTQRDWAKFAVDAVLSDSNHVVVVIGTDTIIRWASPSAKQYGFDPVGASVAAIVHQDELDQLAAIFKLAEEVPERGPTELANIIVPIRTITPLGIIPTEASGRWIHDRSDDTWWLVAILRDIRSRAAIEQALRLLAKGSSDTDMLQVILSAAHGTGGVEGAQLIWCRVDAPMGTGGDLGEDLASVESSLGLDADQSIQAIVIPGMAWGYALRVVGYEMYLGTLAIWGKGQEPAPEFVQLAMDPVIDIAALALERLHRQTELERRATTDLLTGVLNRHGFFSELEKSSSSSAVMYIDLDEFKAVNDDYGHTMGDRLLSVVAKRLVDAVREHDLVGRVGGDEFAVLCRSVTADEAQLVADRVIKSLNHTFSIEGRHIATGASLGVAYCAQAGNGRVMLDQADKALLSAKASGKGRAVLVIVEE